MGASCNEHHECIRDRARCCYLGDWASGIRQISPIHGHYSIACNLQSVLTLNNTAESRAVYSRHKNRMMDPARNLPHHNARQVLNHRLGHYLHKDRFSGGNELPRTTHTWKIPVTNPPVARTRQHQIIKVRRTPDHQPGAFLLYANSIRSVIGRPESDPWHNIEPFTRKYQT